MLSLEISEFQLPIQTFNHVEINLFSTGEIGPPGRAGVPGKMGFKGTTGPKGIKGEMGDKGSKGTYQYSGGCRKFERGVLRPIE